MPWFLNPNIYHNLPAYQNPEVYLFIAKLAATLIFAFSSWKRGVSKRNLLAITYLFFYGIFLTVMLFMHNTVILGLRIFGPTEKAFSYDFHLYSLILLGAVILFQGTRLLHSAFLFKSGDEENGSREAIRATWVVLAVAIPLIPLQFFGIVLTLFSLINLALIKLVLQRTSAISRQTDIGEPLLPISNLSFDS